MQKGLSKLIHISSERPYFSFRVVSDISYIKQSDTHGNYDVVNLLSTADFPFKKPSICKVSRGSPTYSISSPENVRTRKSGAFRLFSTLSSVFFISFRYSISIPDFLVAFQYHAPANTIGERFLVSSAESSLTRIFELNSIQHSKALLLTLQKFPSQILLVHLIMYYDVSLALTGLSCSFKMRILRRIHYNGPHSHQQTINER